MVLVRAFDSWLGRFFLHLFFRVRLRLGEYWLVDWMLAAGVLARIDDSRWLLDQGTLDWLARLRVLSVAFGLRHIRLRLDSADHAGALIFHLPP